MRAWVIRVLGRAFATSTDYLLYFCAPSSLFIDLEAVRAVVITLLGPSGWEASWALPWMVFGRMSTSTRRFCFLPASVAFEAIGRRSAKPVAPMRAGFTPSC